MKLLYKRKHWDVSKSSRNVVLVQGKPITVLDSKLYKSEKELFKAAINVVLKKDKKQVSRYEKYLKGNRERCRKWRKKNPDRVSAYRSKNKEYYRKYNRDYMKKWRARLKAQAHGD